MRFLHRLRSIVRWIVQRDRAERDLHDELETFVDIAAAEHVSGGAAPADARRAAMLHLGGIEQAKERVRAGRPGAWLDAVGRDVHCGVRQIRRQRAFSAIVGATLALGVGLTASIFSVLHAVVLRPLPFPAVDRLVMVWQTDRSAGTTREPVSVPDLLDFIERSDQIDRFGALNASEATVQQRGQDPLHVEALSVSDSTLALLGVEPVAGRSFEPREFGAGSAPAILISERLWARVFHRRSSAIGASLSVNDRPATIVGVVEDAADFGVQQVLSSSANARGFADRDTRARVDLWLPLRTERSAPRGFHGMLMLGRLAAGSTHASAQAELTRIARDLERIYPENDGRGVFVEPIADVVLSGIWTPIVLLTAGVGLVLLTACGNLAILLLARGTTRTAEIVVRLALGAERRRLIRQFVIENVLLSSAGAGLGLVLAYWTLNAIRTLAPADIPRIATAGIDSSVVLVALATTAVIAVALALLPVAQVRARASGPVLIDRSKPGAGPAHGHLRSMLVAVEIAVAVLLLTSAGLLTRSLWRISQVDPGFDAAQVVKAEFQLPPARYPLRFARPAATGSSFTRFVDGLIERTQGLPEVEAIALASHHPLDAGFTTSFTVVGAADARSEEELAVRAITPRYFATMRVPIVSGRPLDDSDAASSVRAAVVNEAFVDRFMTSGNPLDRRLRFFGSEWRIVGVAGNERFRGVTSVAPPAAYVPLHHAPWPRLALVARTASGNPVSVAPMLRSAVGDIDPALAMFAVEPIEETLTSPFAQHRFLTALLGLFALCAVTLATIGVYGVLSYTVAQKTRDIGVRLALGADARQVFQLVARESLAMTAAGVLAGIGLAIASSRALTSLLFEVAPTDPATLGAVVFLVVTVAAAATWRPARRAIRIDPLVALRQ